MFFAVLFTIVETCKQPKCTFMNRQRKDGIFIQCFLTQPLKKKERKNVIFSNMDVLEDYPTK